MAFVINGSNKPTVYYKYVSVIPQYSCPLFFIKRAPRGIYWLFPFKRLNYSKLASHQCISRCFSEVNISHIIVLVEK